MHLQVIPTQNIWLHNQGTKERRFYFNIEMMCSYKRPWYNYKLADDFCQQEI